MDRTKAAAEARRRKVSQVAPIGVRLVDAFRAGGDRPDRWRAADVTPWWRDASLLGELGPALAGLFDASRPTVVLGLQSRGTLLGALVAAHLGVGLIEVRKNGDSSADSDAWVFATTAPDYQDRHLRLGFRRQLLQAGDRVLLVDDWIETGSQAVAARRLVDVCGAAWLGAAVIVDALNDPRLRRELDVRALLLDRHVWPRPPVSAIKNWTV